MGSINGQWRLEAKAGARALVEFKCNGIELVLGVDRQVRSLGHVLAQQDVGVLIGTPLPRAVRVGEIDRRRRAVKTGGSYSNRFCDIFIVSRAIRGQSCG